MPQSTVEMRPRRMLYHIRRASWQTQFQDESKWQARRQGIKHKYHRDYRSQHLRCGNCHGIVHVKLTFLLSEFVLSSLQRSLINSSLLTTAPLRRDAENFVELMSSVVFVYSWRLRIRTMQYSSTVSTSRYSDANSLLGGTNQMV